MLAAIQAFFIALPQLLKLLGGLVEDFKEVWLREKDRLLAEKLAQASKQAESGDTSKYEDLFGGKK